MKIKDRIIQEILEYVVSELEKETYVNDIRYGQYSCEFFHGYTPAQFRIVLCGSIYTLKPMFFELNQNKPTIQPFILLRLNKTERKLFWLLRKQVKEDKRQEKEEKLAHEKKKLIRENEEMINSLPKERKEQLLREIKLERIVK